MLIKSACLTIYDRVFHHAILHLIINEVECQLQFLRETIPYIYPFLLNIKPLLFFLLLPVFQMYESRLVFNQVWWRFSLPDEYENRVLELGASHFKEEGFALFSALDEEGACLL
jgi:hypothetical protein